MKRTTKVFGILAAAALLACSSLNTQAASGDYPKMAITINTSKSGSAVDYGARALAKVMTEELGANVIVNSCADQIEAVLVVIKLGIHKENFGETDHDHVVDAVQLEVILIA